MVKQQTCEERINFELEARLEDLRHLWKAYCQGDEEVEDIDSFPEYGLCFDYIQGGTDYNERAGYFRYQLSTGGPGDEFRFFCDSDLFCYRVEYWFLDWYDGASRILLGEDKELLLDIFLWFKEMGEVEIQRSYSYPN